MPTASVCYAGFVARWDSPFVLATAGTLAAHLILIVAADAVAITHPLRLDPPAPHVKLLDIQVQRRESPPAHREEPRPLRPAIKPSDSVKPRVAALPAQPVAAPPHAPSPPVEPPPTTTSSPQAGGPTVTMDDIAPAATGVPVARQTAVLGSGAAPGTGAEPGTANAPHAGGPVSVAMIKQPALPKRDYGYVLSTDYPPEARRLAIEGTLKVRLVVDTSGKVISATLLDRLGYGLDELALAQARTFEFAPARDADNRPVTSIVVWTFRMTPPK
jgi:protein TonB